MLAEDLDGWPVHGWIVIDDYQRLAASEASESFVATVIERLARAAPPRRQGAAVLGAAAEHPSTGTCSKCRRRARDDGGRGRGDPRRRATELASGLVALAGGWPAVVGPPVMAPQARDVDAVLPETLYDFFAEEIYDGLEPRLRKDLRAARDDAARRSRAVVTLLGPERGQQTVDEALALGIFDERDDRLELHPLVESFFEKRARAETRAEAVEAFPTAWAYYTAQKEPDAAFDLAHELGVPSDVDRLLIESMDELLNSARLSTLETRVGRAVRLVGETPAVLVAQAEIALRRGRHLTAQALADRAVRADGSRPEVMYRAYLLGGRAAHIGQREEDALTLYQRAEAASANDQQRRLAKWGRLTAAASLELDMAADLLQELQVLPRGSLRPDGSVADCGQEARSRPEIRFDSRPGGSEAG